MTLTSSLALLADAVLVVHVGIAAFVVAGPLLVVAGNVGDWRWANNPWFRIAHLAAIGIVVAESWLGVVCPLTTLEMWLRSRAGEASYAGGFIEHWLQQLLYYRAPAWVFVAAYSAFGVLVLATWWYFPPRLRCRRDHVVERIGVTSAFSAAARSSPPAAPPTPDSDSRAAPVG